MGGVAVTQIGQWQHESDFKEYVTLLAVAHFAYAQYWIFCGAMQACTYGKIEACLADETEADRQ